MSITVIQPLFATPKTIGLPETVVMDQVLGSSKDSERCVFVYQLADEHDICFSEGSKRVERPNVEVRRSATPIEHRLKLAACSSGEAREKFDVIQDVFDELGNRTRSRVRLRLS